MWVTTFHVHDGQCNLCVVLKKGGFREVDRQVVAVCSDHKTANQVLRGQFTPLWKQGEEEPPQEAARNEGDPVSRRKIEQDNPRASQVETEACVCGHSREEHGGDPKYPGSTDCGECECIMFEIDK
jgi:hypothetical protein